MVDFNPEGGVGERERERLNPSSDLREKLELNRELSAWRVTNIPTTEEYQYSYLTYQALPTILPHFRWEH